MKPTIILLLVTALHAQVPKQVRIFVGDMSSHDVNLGTWSGAEHAAVTDGQGLAVQCATAIDTPGTGWDSYHSYTSSGDYAKIPDAAYDFLGSCRDLAVITTDPERADYVLLIDHQRFMNIVKYNKVVLMNRTGNVVWADQTWRVPNALKDACAFLRNHR